MKTALFLLPLAGISSLVSANGTIKHCTSSGCSSGCTSGSYVPPDNGTGGCVKINSQSAQSLGTDSNYIFTVYTDENCSNNAKALRGGSCYNGNFKSFSYDRGS